jgi:hypothetical protein
VKSVLCAIPIHVMLALGIPLKMAAADHDLSWILVVLQIRGSRRELCGGLGCGLYAEMSWWFCNPQRGLA